METTPTATDGDHDRRPGRKAWLVVALIAAAVVLAGAIILIRLGTKSPQAAPLPPAEFTVPSAAPSAGPSAEPTVAPGPLPTLASVIPTESPRTAAPAVPDQSKPRPQTPGPLTVRELAVPAVGIDATVVGGAISAGELQVPRDVAQVAQWDGSAALSSASGTVLVAGHVDNVNQGQGAMWPLHLVRPGDAVYLTDNAVVTRWRIVSLQVIEKSKLPQQLFVGDHGDRKLALVTCGGDIHDGNYDSNVIAIAVPF